MEKMILPDLVESLSFALMVSYYREMAAFSFEAKPEREIRSRWDSLASFLSEFTPGNTSALLIKKKKKTNSNYILNGLYS